MCEKAKLPGESGIVPENNSTAEQVELSVFGDGKRDWNVGNRPEPIDGVDVLGRGARTSGIGSGLGFGRGSTVGRGGFTQERRNPTSRLPETRIPWNPQLFWFVFWFGWRYPPMFRRR